MGGSGRYENERECDQSDFVWQSKRMANLIDVGMRSTLLIAIIVSQRKHCIPFQSAQCLRCMQGCFLLLAAVPEGRLESSY